MRRRPPLALMLLPLLLGGITAFFLLGRAQDRSAPGEGPGDAASQAPVAALLGLAPRLRGLRTGGTGRADAEVLARALVDRALEGPSEPPRALVLAALAHEDWAVQWAGVLALTRYGEPDDDLLRALAPLLAKEEPWLRRSAALAAGYFAAADAPELDAALERAAGDQDAGVRAAVVRALARGAARHLERVPLLRDALADKEQDVRGAAAYGLAQIEIQERLPAPEQRALLTPLRAALRDESSEVRMYAAMALGRMGPGAAPLVPDLLPLLDDEHVLVQSQAATALGSVGTPALPALERALMGQPGPRASLLLWALRLVGAPALPVLRRALEHDSGSVRVQAAMKLWELERDANTVLPVLSAALASADPEVVLQGARVAGRLGSAAAPLVPALQALEEHAEEPVRRAAAGALVLVRPAGGK